MDIEKAVDAALKARIPGGSEAWVWIMPQADAFKPSEHQRDIARAMVRAALDTAAANADLAADNARMAKRVDDARDHITWALPLAKGYAASNRHQVNLSIIAGCESFLAGGDA